MKRHYTRASFISLVAATLGLTSFGVGACSSFRDLDAVELRASDDAGLDASDADMGVDAPGADAASGIDAADVAIDFGPCGPPVDWTSDTNFGDPTRNSCAPNLLTARCGGDTQRRCGLYLETGVQPPELRTTCRHLSDFGELADGDLCGSAVQDPDADRVCRVGLICTGWESIDRREPRRVTCNHICSMSEDDCPADYFCVQEFPEIPGIGVCVPGCDPYDPETCPIGQVCAPDFAYPRKSRTPRFRCRHDINSAEEPPTGLGEACSLGDASSPFRSCAGQEICYPLAPGAPEDKQASCVRPCQIDADCEASGEGLRCPECGEGPWALRFCQPMEQ